MGIKALPALLKESTQAFIKTHLSYYAFKRVMIDISGVLYRYKMASGDRWLENMIRFFSCFRQHGVAFAVVLDGVAPVLKGAELEKRGDAKEKEEQKYAELAYALNEYNQTGIVTPFLQEESAKLLNRSSITGKGESIVKSVSLMHPEVKYFNAQLLEKELARKGVNMRPTPEDKQRLVKVMRELGIEVIQAAGEAEQYCCSAVEAGYADVVYTNDSDVLVYGNEHAISDLNPATGECTSLSLSRTLAGLGMSFPQFVDYCILCGCDYNSNVPGIGAKKAMGYIKKYGSLEALEYYRALDLTCVNFREVRECFRKCDCTQPRFSSTLKHDSSLVAIQNCFAMNSLRVDHLWIHKLWFPQVIVIRVALY